MPQTLKEYIRHEIRPTRKAERIIGIKRFWNTVDGNKCNKYINDYKKYFLMLFTWTEQFCNFPSHVFTAHVCAKGKRT
jgi:hypothetical protein